MATDDRLHLVIRFGEDLRDIWVNQWWLIVPPLGNRPQKAQYLLDQAALSLAVSEG